MHKEIRNYCSHLNCFLIYRHKTFNLRVAFSAISSNFLESLAENTFRSLRYSRPNTFRSSRYSRPNKWKVASSQNDNTLVSFLPYFLSYQTIKNSISLHFFFFLLILLLLFFFSPNKQNLKSY